MTDEPALPAADREAVRLMFARPWTFVRGMTDVADLPPIAGSVEVAPAAPTSASRASSTR